MDEKKFFIYICYSPNDELCHCNRIKHEHPKTNNESQQNQKWKSDIHTIKDPTKEQGVSLINGAPVRQSQLFFLLFISIKIVCSM